jgi:GTP-binding protein YchF
VFGDPNVQHVEGKVHPSDDIETINTELILADIQSIDGRLAKVGKDPKQKALAETLQKARNILDGGQTLYSEGFDPEQLRDLQLLTAKPFIYVFNLDENDLKNNNLKIDLKKLVAPAESIFLCAKIEAELSELDSDDAAELLQDLGQDESGLHALIHSGYEALGLQTFLTAGPSEVRAWTIKRGATAPNAAGEIHTDFEKGFIKAEVVNYGDLLSAGSLQAARAAGKARLEGKDYIMRENDVVEFRFNV